MRAQKTVQRAKQTGLLKGCFLGRLALAASRHLGKFLDVAAPDLEAQSRILQKVAHAVEILVAVVCCACIYVDSDVEPAPSLHEVQQPVHQLALRQHFWKGRKEAASLFKVLHFFRNLRDVHEDNLR